MSKELLLVMNPVAGTKSANKFLVKIVSLFSERDFACQVQMTSESTNAEKIVLQYGAEKDLIVCIGGDGTFNEVVSGCLKSKIHPMIGYIPTGSTNDFAVGMNILLDPIKAVNNILRFKPITIDVGLFNGRAFAYTACFGAFTKASYNTSRELKNSLGYFAYILEGAKEISDIKSFHIQMESEHRCLEGKFIFGAVCNSKRLGGGLIHFSNNQVDMNDGLFEVLLVRQPKNLSEFMQIVFGLNTEKYDGPMFEFFSTDKLTVLSDGDVDWTIDGEHQKGDALVEIKNIQSAVSLLA